MISKPWAYLLPSKHTQVGDDVEAVGLLTVGQGKSTSDDCSDGDEAKQPPPNRLAHIANTASQFALFLLPSFVANRLQPSRAPEEDLRSTAWLDGLRGLAAWAVVNTHIATAIFRSAGRMWDPNIQGQSFMQMPIIRLIYKGETSVAIFFIVSGYALSTGAVKLMNTNPRDPALGFRKLASSMIRRPVRLFFPAWVAAMIVFWLIRFNLFAVTSAAMSDKSVAMGFDFLDEYPERDASFLSQACDMFRADLRLLSIDYAGAARLQHPYLEVLWTIAMEYRGSLHLWLTHLGLYFMHRRARIALVCFLIFFGRVSHNFEMPLFWAGHLLAELAAKKSSTVYSPTLNFLLIFLDGILFLLAAFVASVPAYQPGESTFYSWLVYITPFVTFWTPFPSSTLKEGGNFGEVKRMWVAVGTIIMISVINRRPMFQRFFCLSPIRYIGKISFALYLVHLWIVRGLGLFIWYRLFQAFGQSHWFPIYVAFIIGYIINLSITIWIADIFWRTVDMGSITLGKKVEHWLLSE